MDKKINLPSYGSLLLAFIFLQPLLDNYYFLNDSRFQVAGFSFVTIFRFMALACFFVWACRRRLLPRPALWACLAYGFLSALYFCGHHLAAQRLLLPSGLELHYSLPSEAFYILRLAYPLILLLLLYFSGLQRRHLLLCLLATAALISGLIIVTNLLGLSLNSYSNEPIKGSIISWFLSGSQQPDPNHLPSKAFFVFANQAAAIQILLLVPVFLFFIRHTTFISTLILAAQLVASAMLGTKLAAFGSLAVLACCLGLHFFGLLIPAPGRQRRYRALLLACLILLGGGFLVYKGPALRLLDILNNTIRQENTRREEHMRREEQARREQERQRDEGKEASSGSESPEAAYIRKNYKRLRINPQFILESYPYTQDEEFWLAIMKEAPERILNYRYLETAMIRRVKELGGGRIHDFFGISYNKMLSVFNIERDLLAQYYSLGYLGLLLFFVPYPLILAYLLYRLIRRRSWPSLGQLCLAAAVLATFATGYLTGNVLDSIYVMTLLSAVLALLALDILPRGTAVASTEQSRSLTKIHNGEGI